MRDAVKILPKYIVVKFKENSSYFNTNTPYIGTLRPSGNYGVVASEGGGVWLYSRDSTVFTVIHECGFGPVPKPQNPPESQPTEDTTMSPKELVHKIHTDSVVSHLQNPDSLLRVELYGGQVVNWDINMPPEDSVVRVITDPQEVALHKIDMEIKEMNEEHNRKYDDLMERRRAIVGSNADNEHE